MRFLEQTPSFLFFTGKGGVGKTSIACATAIHLVQTGARVLLVSTDPASNVGQVFGAAIGSRVTPIAEVPGLAALEIDPQAAAEVYRERIVGPVKGVLPDAVVAGIEEQLSGACTTEIAAFDEFTALLTDERFVADYDHIVFDTAPTGHTIRLLQLPGAWSGFLEAGKGDASCLGPLAGLAKQKERYKAAVAALSEPQRTRLVLVARAQAASLAEVARTHGELAANGIGHQHLVVNSLMPATEAEGDALAAAIYEREQTALAELPDTLLLLEATGAYHRETARQMGASGLGEKFTTPMMQLQDPKRTRILLVTLAETTPVLEAASLQDDLRRAGIESWAWVVNNSIAAAGPTSGLLRRRAHSELPQIRAVAEEHAARHALVPLLREEPVGAERLLALTQVANQGD